MAETADLLKYLITESDDRNLQLVKTALVKLLYLTDVEAIRRGLPRLSNVHWIYYKYGPYAFEIEDALSQFVGFQIDEMERVSAAGRKYRTYRVQEETPSRLSPEEKSLLNSVIDRWAGESLEKLLNYVYFETEPMLTAEWGKALDFTVVAKREPHVDLKEYIIRQGGREAVERLRDLKGRFWQSREATQPRRVRPTPSPRYDEIFRHAMKAMDEEDSKGIG